MSNLIILLARQRSGTGALGSMLDQHSEVRYLGEVFHDNEIRRTENYFNFYLSKVAEDRNHSLPGNAESLFNEYVEFILAAQKKVNVILDIKYSSTHHFNGYWHAPYDAPKLFKLAAKKSVKILHLKRKNLLKTYISGRLAEQNKAWHVTDSTVLKVSTLKINTAQLLNYLKATHREVSHFDSALKKYNGVIEVEYSSIFTPEGLPVLPEVKRLSDFLNVSSDEFTNIKPAFIKQADDKLINVIENYEEVVAALADTPHAWMVA